jgi:hypothetical protein
VTRLAVAVLALVLAASAAAAAPHRYAGRTAQGTPISFRLSADGHRLDRISVGYYAACDAEIALASTATRRAAVPVRASGAFRVRVGAVTIAGRVRGARASGTMRVRAGGCVSPAVPWSART